MSIAQGDEPTAKPAARGTFAALYYRNYRTFWYGNAVSFTGDWLDQVALNWLVISTTGNPAMLGLVNLGRGLPMVFFTILGGAVADRVDRRRLLLWTQLAAMLVATALALTVAFLDASIWVLLALATARGIVTAFNLPARHALMYHLVPHEAMGSAVALNSITVNMAKIAGPLAAAGIIAGFGITVCFIVNAASFILVMAMTMLLDLPRHTAPARQQRLVSTMVEGVDYLRRDRVMLMLVAVALVPTFFCLPYLQFLAVFAAQVFHAGPEGLGIMTALAAGGSICGGLLAAWLQRESRTGRMMLIFMGVFGLSLVAFAFAPSIHVGLPLLFCAGAMQLAYNSSNTAILQLRVDDAYRGRVLSTLFMTRGLMPVGTALMAVVATVIGPRWALGSMSLIVVVFTAALWLFAPALRRLKV